MIAVSKISPIRLSLLALAVTAIWCFSADSALAQFNPIDVEPIDTGQAFGDDGGDGGWRWWWQRGRSGR